ncbi:MAG: ABC transporter ATP-binding protein, partial [Mesorhizobium sp.]
EIPMIAVDGHEGHFSRCVRFNEIDWEALPPGAKKVNERVEPGAPVLKIEDLKKYYKVGGSEVFGSSEGRVVKANETISFMARESETVAIVGESGCGKSTLAKVLLGLETASSGSVTLGNQQIQSTGVEKRSVETVSSIQMVFQNPFDTLNPSHTVGSQIIRTLEKFNVGNTVADRRQRMLELLDLVKLPRAFETRKPRQLSGGQKQRIGVARAFAGDAKVVVADEPVSALDVSVQAAVTELLMDIQRKNKTTMLFISHDLSVVRYIADRVVVMYLGYIVEQGTTDQIFSPPYHPYTEALLSAIPIADTSVIKKHIVLEGDIPSAMNPPTGCPFQTRCGYKKLVPDNLCETQVPPVKNLGDGHLSLCWLADDVLAKMEPVIKFDKEHAAHEGLPDDAPQGIGPGFAGAPPKRPRGKRPKLTDG